MLVTDSVRRVAEDALSYEQAREQLSTVVKQLEAGGLTLEQSIELWERGEQLAAVCTQWLDGARARLAAALARQQDTSRPDPAAEPEAPF